MRAETVVQLLDRLDEAGIDAWIDGGWAVDALLGVQSRCHKDLDIVIPHDRLDHFNQFIERGGFVPDISHTPYNWELVNPDGDRIDVHLVDLTATRLDRFGIEVYGPGGLEYEVGSLEGTGEISGRTVRCCTAEFLVRYHTGYDPTEKDYHDVKALHQHFGIPLPWPYDPDGDRTNWYTRLEGID